MPETARDPFERAVAPVLERIGRDLEGAEGIPRHILEAIRERLFRPGLDLGHLAASLGISNNAATTAFRRLLGVPPRRYLHERRVECACRLLLETDLDPRVVAERLGYANFKAFSDAFSRHTGHRPRDYRQAGGAPAAEPAPPPREAAAPREPPPPKTPRERGTAPSGEAIHRKAAAAAPRETPAALASAFGLAGKIGSPLFAAGLAASLTIGRLDSGPALVMALGLACLVAEHVWVSRKNRLEG